MCADHLIRRCNIVRWVCTQGNIQYLHLIENFLCIRVVLCNLVFGLHHGRAELGRESLGHLHRLTDSSALDDNILDFILLGQTSQLREQVTTQCAADTAVLQLDKLLLGLGDLVVSDEGSVDVEPGCVLLVRDLHGVYGILIVLTCSCR